MKKVTVAEFKRHCELFGVRVPTDVEIADAKARDWFVSAEIVGRYYPKRQELHEWKITPSSEDKGFSY